MSESTRIPDPLHEIALVKHEVRQLESELANALRRSQEIRVSLLRKLNTMQASTRNLTSELLAHIFLLVCDQRAALRLGGVCSHWRQITLSTPHLWSFLYLYIRASVDTSERRQNPIYLVQYYLENTGNVPFSLDLRFDHYFCPSKEILGLFSSLLLRREITQKVHGLKLVRAPFEWISSLPRFLNIADVRIYEPTGCLDGILRSHIFHSPRLRLLMLHDLQSTRPVPNNIEHTQITRIFLLRVAIDVAVSLLVRCPNLVQFESTSTTLSELRDVDNIRTYGLVDGPIILHQLEHFSWTHPGGVDGSRLNFIYSRLRFPALRIFHWLTTKCASLDNVALRALLPNFPPTLSFLGITSALGWQRDLVEFVFDYTATTRELRVYGCDYTTMMSMFVVLGGRRRAADQGGVYLPNLRNMSIDGISFLEVTAAREARMVNCIMDTLRHRCRSDNTRFLLQLSRRDGNWAENSRNAFCALKKEGIEVKVWADWKKLRLLEELEGDKSQGASAREKASGKGKVH